MPLTQTVRVDYSVRTTSKRGRVGVAKMPSYARIGALRAALAAGKAAPVAVVSPLADPFTDADWRVAQHARELVDSVVHTWRWRVTVIPSDGHARRFWFRGTLASVTARANAIFTAPHLVLIEPAPVQSGGEIFDRRLNLSTGET